MFLKRQATSYLKNIIIFPPFALIVYYTITNIHTFYRIAVKHKKARTFRHSQCGSSNK